ncbi:hypothetical protein R3P38DRAFT_2858473 [Favolaschia claudopus]|uniref:Eisosome component PIL1-domain-containing protein n=1 Tax=Favolaschia claudopus TaxID=2862362 RepID=A0AAW0DLX9_9AGAR
MFRNAATKIAHNSTLPSLALSGNKDLKPLQDLILLEKNVLTTLQKLSVDFSKASDALRTWGMGEGDDLGDILSASSTILAHWSNALTTYAGMEHTIRDHLKQIRTREEALDELKRRRKATLARADSAEKKLNKMGPEHKNLAQQTDTLNQLQMQIRGMDNEILNEEAALGDFKRSSARTLMGLKFGGLMECCEKGCIVAEVGRGMVAEISEETTPPGLSRAMYLGHQMTQQRVIEADRCVSEIVFKPLPPAATSPSAMGGHAQEASAMTTTTAADDGYGGWNNNNNNGIDPQTTGTESVGGGYDPPPPTNSGFTSVGGTSSGFLPPPDVGGGFMDGGGGGGVGVGSAFSSVSGQYQPPSSVGGYQPPQGPPPGAGGYQPPPPGAYSPGSTYNAAQDTPGGYSPYGLDETGGLSGTGGTGGGAAGGRFATFPVRGRAFSKSGDDGGAGTTNSGFSGISMPNMDAPASLGATRRQDTSGSDFMSAVLDAGEFGTRQQQQPSQSFAQYTIAGSDKEQERDREAQRMQEEHDPAPEYRDYEPTSHAQAFEYPSAGMHDGPPPSAATQVVGSVWTGDNYNDANSNDANSTASTYRGPGSGIRSMSGGLAVEEGGGNRQSTASDDVGLAYMNLGNDQGQHEAAAVDEDADPALLPGENETQRQARLSKHVRFGKETSFGPPSEPPTPMTPEPPYMKRQESTSSLGSGRSRRVPPPVFDPEADERALNAAAAREVSRELDSLTFSPPAPLRIAKVHPQTPVEENWEFAAAASPSREQPPPQPMQQQTQQTSPQRMSPPSQYTAPKSPIAREPSPLVPPAAPFARKMSTENASPLTESPVQPSPFVPGHHTTPSWAITPAPERDTGSPASPRLGAGELSSSPYRAPFANRSTSSLASGGAQTPTGARTISAAAFRRPQKAAALPSSPYPQARAGSGLREASPQPPMPQQRAQSPPRAPTHGMPPTHTHDEDFDYIGAYARDSQAFLDDNHGSPAKADFDYGRLGKVEVVGGPPRSPSYGPGNDGIR